MIKNKQRSHFKLPIFRASFAMLFFLFVCTPLRAYEFQSTSAYQLQSPAVQATQMNVAPSYQSYESTIYTPFSSDAPYSDANSGDNGPSRITNRKNGFDNPADPERDPESPIGEPWILLAFAAAAAGVVYIKRRSATKKSRSC